ncbi:MAG: DUF1553 domain-containing protein [Phycisphaerales bacterium JB063]
MNRDLRRCGFVLSLAWALAGWTGCAEDASSAGSAMPVSALQPASAVVDGSGQLSYNRDVRPILSDKCFACHGPDRAAREADLRLDLPEDGEGYFGAMSVIDLDDPASSELLVRVHTTRSRLIMPPPAAKLTLTDGEKSVLTRWVEQGAQYERHWSFERLPDRVAVPEVGDTDWPRDDIDRFVLAKLEEQGVEPSEEATRERWLRRVTYDLTGLPPTPDEVDAFVGDVSDSAYETVVDRLLASSRYGERMAVPWLDLARYADTYGYSVDGFRLSWPYRDWVIASFNDNLPYDDFLTWQLAGDLLPDATRDQQLATAFNRLHRMNAEGGAIREEWRNEYVADRLHTFGTAYLGLTLECARCHDHRYDPIEQREYYELFAFFNNIDESGTTEFQRGDIIPPPSMLLPDAGQAETYQQLRDEVDEAELALGALIESRASAFEQWLASGPVPGVMPELVGDYPLDEAQGNTLSNRVAGGAAGQLNPGESPAVPSPVSGVHGGALRFDGDNLAHLPGVGDLDRWTPFTIAFWLRVDALDDGPARVIVKRTSGTDVGPYGFDLLLEGDALVARAYRHWPGNAIGVRAAGAVRAGQWVHVVWRYDGSSRAAGLTLDVDGVRVEAEVLRDGPMLKAVGGGSPYGPGGHDLVLGQRFRDRGLAQGELDEVRIIRRTVSDLEAEQLYDGEALTKALSRQDADALRGYYFSAIDPPARAARVALDEARQRLIEYETGIPEIAVMREMAQARPAHVLNRGLYDAERTEANRVVRDVPEQVMPWIGDAPRDRLGLAQWVTADDHPLTARVAVNRLWAMCFGNGLVGTTDNFGLQGAWPTHPELLDYLARSFVDSGWDTKAMLRRIVLSATYRQDSAAARTQWRNDPDNTLLARGPARRLDAEMIRDTALAASGLMVEHVGGPSVHPYQPAGLWEEVGGVTYAVGGGEALYRRSLYTVWKRAVPMPNMMAFDAPSREACTAERSETNTPLQALVLLNDVQFVEAARVLAQRVMLAVDGDAERIALGFRLLTGRLPREAEAARLLALLESQRAILVSGQDDAELLLAVGASPRDASLSANEHAAMTVVMHAILNLDATVWQR